MTRAAQLDPDSADLTLLQDRQVAVLGFGPLATAHALNLRDSGVDVRVAAPADSRAAGRAEVEGLLVVEAAAALAQADIIVLPTDGPAEVLEAQPLLRETLEPGDLVLVTGGAPIRFDGLTVPNGVDLVVLQEIGGADRLRGEYLDGRGVPCLVGVETDATGVAWPVLTAYCAALGALRSGALVSSASELAEAAAYADGAVHEATRRLVEDGFDALVDRGVGEEVAYLVTLHELRARIEAACSVGYGTDDVPAEQVAEAPSRRAVAQAAHPLDAVGQRVRALMSWRR